MTALLSTLRAACLPILAVVCVWTGVWIALGEGRFEQDIRRDLGLEISVWEREEAQYVVITHDDPTYRTLLSDRARLLHSGPDVHGPPFGQLSMVVDRGVQTLAAAAIVPAPAVHADLQRRARGLLETKAPLRWARTADSVAGFSWHDDRDVGRLQHIVERDLVPDVVRYRSPLGLSDAIRVIGLVAGGLLAGLMLVAVPLFAGVQIAQETHENTLQPICGTALSPRQVVLGLTSAPLALVGVVALPQVAIVLLAAMLAGSLVPALGFVPLTVIVGLFLAMLTQVVGYAAGSRRGPGLVAVGLLASLVVMLLVGIGLGARLSHDTLGLVTVAPHAGVVHLLRETFLSAGRLSLAEAWNLDVRLMFAAAAFVVLTGTAHLALERRLSGRSGPSLRPFEAWVAVAVLSLASMLALPELEHGDFGPPVLVISLALLAVPLQLVLMARVPMGDGPTRGQHVPVGELLGEYATWIGAHGALAIVVVVGAGGSLHEVDPIGLLHLGWAFLVAGLLAIRITARPTTAVGAIAVVVSAIAVCFEFGTGAVFAVDRGEPFALVPLFEVSPALGLAQLAMLVLVPWLLFRSLRRSPATAA
jgi:hypothetical protein